MTVSIVPSTGLLACLLGVKYEMGRVELLGFIEKKGSRAKRLKANDRKVARTDDRVGTPLPPS